MMGVPGWNLGFVNCAKIMHCARSRPLRLQPMRYILKSFGLPIIWSQRFNGIAWKNPGRASRFKSYATNYSCCRANSLARRTAQFFASESRRCYTIWPRTSCARSIDSSRSRYEIAVFTPDSGMIAVDFSTMSDLQHKEELVTMMQALYAEDKSDFPVDQSRFGINVECLVANPSQGRIVLFRQGELLCGYALLVPYWSNEFGGTLLFVDAMFVIPEARNRSIGRRFFKFLDQTRPFGAVALALEVSPGNAGALRLYESLGFRRQKNLVLTYSFTDDRTDGI